MINKKGFFTNIALLFAIGVGVYSGIVSLTLNNASKDIVKYKIHSGIESVMDFYQTNSSLFKNNSNDDYTDCPVDEETEVSICQALIVTPDNVFQLLKNSITTHQNVDDSNLSIEVAPDVYVTIPDSLGTGVAKDARVLFSNIIFSVKSYYACSIIMNNTAGLNSVAYFKDRTNVARKSVTLNTEEWSSFEGYSKLDVCAIIQPVRNGAGIVDDNFTFIHLEL